MTTRCHVCGVETGIRCSKCRVVYYCGRMHQMHDWSRHRNECARLKKEREDAEELEERRLSEERVDAIPDPTQISPVQDEEGSDLFSDSLSTGIGQRPMFQRPYSHVFGGTMTNSESLGDMFDEEDENYYDEYMGIQTDMGIRPGFLDGRRKSSYERLSEYDIQKNTIPQEPSKEVQKNLISRHLSQVYEEEEIWCIINSIWFNKWKRYVNYTSEENGPHPGPIDNLSIIKNSKFFELWIETTEGDLPSTSSELESDDNDNYCPVSILELRDDIKENDDFYIIPSEAFDSLLEWFGGKYEGYAPTIPRMTNKTQGPAALHEYSIELYPLIIPCAAIPNNYENNNLDWKVLRISRYWDFNEVSESILSFFGNKYDSSKDNVLWLRYMRYVNDDFGFLMNRSGNGNFNDFGVKEESKDSVLIAERVSNVQYHNRSMVDPKDRFRDIGDCYEDCRSMRRMLCQFHANFEYLYHVKVTLKEDEKERINYLYSKEGMKDFVDDKKYNVIKICHSVVGIEKEGISTFKTFLV